MYCLNYEYIYFYFLKLGVFFKNIFQKRESIKNLPSIILKYHEYISSLSKYKKKTFSFPINIKIIPFKSKNYILLFN